MTEFKVGDIVKRVGYSLWPSEFGQVGEFYRVLSIYKEKPVVIEGKTSDPNNFELVSSPYSKKFKPGDKVFHKEYNTVETVRDTPEDCLAFDSQNKIWLSTFYSDEDDLELYETAETFPFKVGDKVITHNPIIIRNSLKGKVGTIINLVNTEKGIIEIDYGEYTQFGYMIGDNLELYLEPNEDKPSQTTGGPSSYYDFDPGWLTWNDVADYKAKTQWKEYSFHLGNIGKAIFRWGDKSGTSKVYDAEKIVYSALRVLMMLSGPKRVQEYLKTLQDDPQFKVGDTK